MSKLFNRRGFINKSALATITTVLGADIVFAGNLQKGVLPLVFENTDDLLPGKHPDLIILSNKPWNVETPTHLLDDEITPADKMFIRNNGLVPEAFDLENWRLLIDGESVLEQKSYSLAELKSRFKHYTYQLTLECGGNGRAGFYPPASGNQWNEGAVSCGKWTGVRLKDVLMDAGIKEDAVYIGYYGKDIHISGDPGKSPISRGVPISKALEDESLIAWSLNGEDIPVMNGFPLRLVFGGWPASVSGKWLHRISVRNKVHDGEKMGGDSYKIPRYPVMPGEKVNETELEIIESMPVRSIITSPRNGGILKNRRNLELRGHAWAGDLEVKEMHVSIDFGATWQKCELSRPVNRLAWQHWKTQVTFPSNGYFELWARATDVNGRSQPMVTPSWNPKGYLNNSCQRIAVKVEVS